MAKTVSMLRAFLKLQATALRKSHLPNGPTEQVLKHQGGAIADEFVESIRRRVVALNKMIVFRSVCVNRNRTPREMLDATNRRQYCDLSINASLEVVDSIPRGGREVEDVYFFEPDKSLYDDYETISREDLEKEFEFNGLKPDPYAVAAFNENNPDFADEYPNSTYWKGASGKYCRIKFCQWADHNYNIHISRDVRRFGKGWFGGVRK